MDIFLNWLILMGIFGLALASPGPDLVIAIRYALLHSRLKGIMAALGFAIGVAVHVTYVLVGLATLIEQSILLFTIIKIIGATYLFYIGVKALLSKGADENQLDEQITKPKRRNNVLSNKKAFMTGFLTNLLNPKATMFFLAVFSQFISVDTVISVKVLYAFTCISMTFLWFSFVTLALSNKIIKKRFLKFSKWIDKVCGILLIGLSVKLLLTTSANE